MTMREHALALARQGFQVFPLKAGSKGQPLLKGWQNVATSDQAQVESWWTQWPDANVGIHCAGLCVVDIDPKKGGYESLDALHAEIADEDGCGFPATLEVDTPSGGRHLYYLCADGARNTVDVLGPGIDTRATAGYVVGPGSRTEVGEYRVAVEEEISVLPEALLSRLLARQVASVGERGEQSPVVDTDADTAVERARDFLSRHPSAVEGHGGDHHTFRTICRIRDFGVPRDRALEALADWNERCSPPWDAAELALKVQNAYAYAQDAAGKLTPEALGFGVDQPQIGNDQSQVENDPATQVAYRELMHPADVVLDDVLRSEYLIKGFLERQSNAVLFGQWNVGKTFVVLDMAACIALGEKWFDRRVRQGRVLYLGYEGLRAMKKRLKALRDKYPGLNDRAVPFRYEGLIRPLTSGEGHREVGAILKAFTVLHGGPPDLIIIDPLANALGGDDADAALMGSLNQFIAELMKKQHCTVLRVHHSGHGNQERARGHSSLPAGVDTEIRVTENDIATTKQRDDVRGRMGFKLEVVTLGLDGDGDKVTTCVVTHVPDNELDPALTSSQQEVMDKLLRSKKDGDFVSKTEVADAMPDGLAPQKKREILGVLEKKLYLRIEGKGYVICERGPMGIFD
jgi:hypothetical protein